MLILGIAGILIGGILIYTSKKYLRYPEEGENRSDKPTLAQAIHETIFGYFALVAGAFILIIYFVNLQF